MPRSLPLPWSGLPLRLLLLLRCTVRLEAVVAAAAPATVAAGELCMDAKLLLGSAALAACIENESEVPRIKLLCSDTMLPL